MHTARGAAIVLQQMAGQRGSRVAKYDYRENVDERCV